jgi:putative copper export protein
MAPFDTLMVLAHWVFLVCAVFVAGAFALRVLVTAPSGADLCMPAGRNRCLGETASRYLIVLSAAALLANALHTVLHASAVTDTPLGEVFSIIPVFLHKTRFGRLAVLRTAVISVVVLVSWYSAAKGTRRAAAAGIPASFLMLATMSMSGHQGAQGFLRLPFFLDVLHLSAVSLWIGGLFFIRLCYSYVLKDAGGGALDIFSSLIKRFSDTATGAVLVVLATGVVLSALNIEQPSRMVTTLYGRVLLFKIGLAGIIFALGGVNKFLLVPAFKDAEKGEEQPRLPELRRRLYGLVTLEMAAGLAVLLATSLLTHLSPVD